MFAGIGVFPMALWALFVGIGQAAVAWVLIAMFVTTFGARVIAVTALSRQARY
jgi:hypothetical protein